LRLKKKEKKGDTRSLNQNLTRFCQCQRQTD
jgi:hypothetical protein